MRTPRRRRWWLLAFVPAGAVAAACVGDTGPANGDSGVPDVSTDAPSLDSTTDAGPTDAAPACNLDAQFQSLTPVPGLAGLGSVARFSSDELTAYFALLSDAGIDQLYQASRATLSDSFGTPTILANVNDAVGESTPWVSADGKTIFYGHSENVGTASARDLWYATRTDTIGAFSNPQEVGIINDPTHEDDYVSQATNGDLWFSSRRDVDAGQNEIFHAQAIGGNGFGAPQISPELNSLTESNLYPLLTPDRLHVYFQRGASLTVWMASRSVPSGPFDTPQQVNELTIDGTIMRPSWISPDGCRMYMSKDTPVQMLVASRPAN